jgi:hypothetical protein
VKVKSHIFLTFTLLEMSGHAPADLVPRTESKIPVAWFEFHCFFGFTEETSDLSEIAFPL